MEHQQDYTSLYCMSSTNSSLRSFDLTIEANVTCLLPLAVAVLAAV